jgi:ribosome production factor 2
MAPTQQQAKQAKLKQLSGGKAPKARVTRYLNKTQSLLKENTKAVLLLKGIKCSNDMNIVLKDLRAMKAPNAKLLSKNNVIQTFDDEGQQSLEFLMTKNDCSMFALASHNKKRPNNLCIGRTFDRRMLDIVELGVERYKSLLDYKGNPKKRIESKPLMLFVGDGWHLNAELKRLQNLLIDLHRGDVVDKLVLSGLDHLMVFTTAYNNVDDNEGNPNIKKKMMIHQRTYYCKLKKNPSGGRTPMPFLTPSGPDMDFTIRRTQFATPDVWNMAIKQPTANKAKKVKNRTTNVFGETIGRLHLEKQEIDKMGGKKSKALRIAEKIEKAEEKRVTEMELDQEKSEMQAEFKQTHGYEEE